MSALQLTLVSAKYNLLETARVPIAVIGALVFPTLALCLFVLPQRAVVDNPEFATAAVSSMIVFAFLSAGLFSVGLEFAEQRSKPWAPYLRTLPGSPLARIGGMVLSTLATATAATVPLLVVGALFTQARPAPMNLLAGVLSVIVTALPALLIGAIIGITSGPKAAIAITQVAMFLLAFGGGLFLPPQMFPLWLDRLSTFLPVRQAREVVIATAMGTAIPWWAVVGIVTWTLVLGTLAVLLYRRDEGRRFR